MDKLWYNPEEVKIRKDGKIEYYCEACGAWKTGLFFRTYNARYWRCEECKKAGKLRRQTDLFDVE